MIRITIFQDGKAISDFEAKKSDTDITIGRAPGCSIRLDDPNVSRLHALIRKSGSAFVLERKASFGAVRLNGEEVENAPLQGGEEIVIGPFSMRVALEEGSSPSIASTRAAPPSQDESLYQEEDGRTKFVTASAQALFRFEPGSANVSEFVMDQDIAIFGRASNCDVVLMEKRASRKHIELRRQGLSFFLKDLDSANGTLVNGNTIHEVELVPGDIIQIGDTKIQFTIENKDFFSKQDQFLPVPTHLEESLPTEYADGSQVPANYDPNFPGAFDPNMDPNAVPGMEAPPEEVEKSLIKRAIKKYKSLKPTQRYLVLLLIIAMIGALAGQEDDKPKKQTKVAIDPVTGRPIRNINTISPAQRKVVTDSYQELLKSLEKKDYEKVLVTSNTILSLVDDYRDTKSYVEQAKKGIQEKEEREREERLAKQREEIRKTVAALEEKGKPIYEAALKDEKQRGTLNSIIEEIYSKDPNNRLAQEWKDGIRRQDEEDRRQKEIERQKELLRQKAEAAYAAVEGIFKDGQYIKALGEADKLLDIGHSEKEYVSKVETLKNTIRDQLNSILNPLLRDATEQRKEGGDLVKAKELYMQVLKIDISNKDAIKGLESIREVLHVRAKRLYAEGILAESVSDLPEAKDKFIKCERTAPEGDLYKQRCKNKLSKFESFGSSATGTELQ